MLRNYKRWHMLNGRFYLIQLLVTVLNSTFSNAMVLERPSPALALTRNLIRTLCLSLQLAKYCLFDCKVLLTSLLNTLWYLKTEEVIGARHCHRCFSRHFKNSCCKNYLPGSHHPPVKVIFFCSGLFWQDHRFNGNIKQELNVLYN